MLLVATGSAAHAGARSVRIDTSGVCPLDGLAADLADLAGREVVAGDSPAVIRVTTTLDGAYRAHIAFTDEAGTAREPRELQAASCAELESSVAVIVSLIVREPVVARPARPIASADEPAILDSVRPPSIQAGAPFEADVELGVAASTDRTSALVLGTILRRGQLAFAIEGQLGTATDRSLDSGVQVEVAARRLVLAPCWRAGAFGACGLIEGGWVHGQSSGLMDAGSANLPVAAAGLRLEVHARLTGATSLRASVDATQVVARARFLVDDAVVWASPERELWFGAGVIF